MQISNRIYSLIAGLSVLALTVCSGCGGGGGNSGNSGTDGDTSNATVVNGDQSIAFTVGSGQENIGGTLSIPVVMKNESSARAVSCTISYDPKVVAPGESGSTSIRDAAARVGSGIASRRRWGTNSVTLSFVIGPNAQSTTGATLPFKIVGSGTTNLTVSNVTAYSATMQPVQASMKSISGQIKALK